MKLGRTLLAGLLALAGTHALACYTVYDRNGGVVYNEETPPVDMSRPIHETLPARFPGAHMVFDEQAACDSIVPLSRLAEARGGSPLLTDRRTAEALHVPYTIVAGGIALVAPGNVRLSPRVTVVPSESFALTAPSRETVITELRNPPVTTVESADGSARVMGGPAVNLNSVRRAP
jgi:hypothetical protein